MPLTNKQRRFMGLCVNPRSRRKARGKCPPSKVAHKLLKDDPQRRSRKRKRR